MSPPAAPTHVELVSDLRRLRVEGITRLRRLSLPALGQVIRAAGDVEPDRDVEAPAIEHGLRQAIADLGPGVLAEAAARLFGLAPGTRHQTPKQCREDAAVVYDRSVSWFRERYEPVIIDELAESLLLRAHRYGLHLAHLNMQRRTPVSTRLAVQWVERFEAYYRIWTPVTAVGNDLTAYRSTLLEHDRPYDRPPNPADPQDDGYSQDIQAAGYGTRALFYFAGYLTAVEDFIQRYGGLWLLSDAQAEQDVADAIYRIGWHSPLNERDDSYLRGQLAAAGGEQHAFLSRLAEDQRLGRPLHGEWRDWLRTCACSWGPDQSPGREPFPTHRQYPNISARCQVHAVVTACGDYRLLIDEDWHRIADWYRLPVSTKPRVNPETLYVEHVAGRDRAE